MFQLSRAEFDSLRSQIAMSKTGRGGRRTLPYAFTEHGALQAANVLRSSRAVQMSVFVIRAFVKMRETLRAAPELARKLAALEKKLTARLDVHEAAIVQVLQEVMQILNPPPTPGRRRGHRSDSHLDLSSSFPPSLNSVKERGSHGALRSQLFLGLPPRHSSLFSLFVREMR
jgi:predicted amino acid-binding ACT domain protein